MEVNKYSFIAHDKGRLIGPCIKSVKAIIVTFSHTPSVFPFGSNNKTLPVLIAESSVSHLCL